MEPIKDNKNGLLKQEYEFYLALTDHGQSRTGFPIVYYFGTYHNNRVLIMQMLGKDLEAIFNGCSRKFTMKSIIFLTIQLLKRFEVIHQNRILYCDVKPENFLFGTDTNTVYIIDFGLSQFYRDENGQHIPYRHISEIVGTTRYMSINAHKCIQQSRRDDLEAVCYVIIYFLRGSLPWSGLKLPSFDQHNAKICNLKQTIPIEELCQGFPDEFGDLLRLVPSPWCSMFLILTILIVQKSTKTGVH